MHYRFNEFEFDSESLLLTKYGTTLPIRYTEAKVLTLLLERSDKVLSKDDILCHVWQNKTVSEQAVFQNISHLRSILGNHAIKTFSKRGYQWQLETKLVSAVSPLSTSPIQDQYRLHPAPSRKKQPYWLYLTLASLVFTIIGAKYLPSVLEQENPHSTINIAYIPIASANGSVSLELDDNADFNFTPLVHLDTAQFETSAELEYPALAGTHPFVLTGQIRTDNQHFYLDFLLKGPFADWRGQLTSVTTQDLLEQLKQHLNQAFIYDLLSQPQAPELKQANLSIAHQQAPDDMIVLGQLISVYIDMGELDKAMVMAEKLVTLAQRQDKLQQHGNGLLYQSEILTGKALYELSAQKLSLAIEHFETIKDLKRQADAWIARSWLDHQNIDYHAVKTSLLKAAQLADSANDKTRELHALTYLSIMASKHRQQEDKYLYLHQAEDKMKAYQLPSYHFAKIPFHYAIFAVNPADKEPHFKQVLEFTALTPDHWVAQSSRKQLMQYYLKHNRLAQAQALVENLASDNAQNSYLKTILAQAEQQTDTMLDHAKRTFEQARLAGDRFLSLDVALLLCSTQNPHVNYDFYSQYIDENATSSWRQTNELSLMALNL
jgi:DNA-binding winged helix-turn-helix (wHTH) protein/arsenate reductase-like glutaredoxin family protein